MANNSRYKIIGVGLMIGCLFQFQKSNGQAGEPTLAEFFDKLRTISLVKENLHYDTFPDFDFTNFEPLRMAYRSKKISYVVGSTYENKIRTIDFVDGNNIIGRMSVYDFRRFKILTFKKKEVMLDDYPDFPIFCLSKNSRFIAYLNKPFQYQQRYGPKDIASIQILRNDLFPAYALTIRDSYIRMLIEINYINGRSKVIDKLSAMIVFEPDKDNRLLLSSKSYFSEEDIYIPAADFIATLHPSIKSDGMPYWLFSNNFAH